MFFTFFAVLSTGSVFDGTDGSKRGMLKGDTPVDSGGMLKSSIASVPGASKRCVSNVSKGGVPKSSKEGVLKSPKLGVPKGFKKSVSSNRLIGE